MSDIKHRPIKSGIKQTDWLSVQGSIDGLGSEQRVQVFQLMGGNLSNIVYGSSGPISWDDDGVSYTATYIGGNLATVTGGGVVKTFTYSGGQLSGVTVGAA
jgi:hypothetical protein